MHAAVLAFCLCGQVVAPERAPAEAPNNWAFQGSGAAEERPYESTPPEGAVAEESAEPREETAEPSAFQPNFSPPAFRVEAAAQEPQPETEPAESTDSSHGSDGVVQAADEPLEPVQPEADRRPVKSVLRTGATTPVTSSSREPPLRPVRNTLEAGKSPQLLSQALTPPKEGAIPGRPLTLLEAVSRTFDRTQQLWITRAYWKLQIALADYHFALEELQGLEQVSAGRTPDGAILETAKAGAAARVHETEIAAITAQNELADLLRLAPGEPLPLPSDTPHLGKYRTFFETLFAARTPPARARLIDRTLPLRQELLEVRAAAVQSGVQAVQGVEAAYSQGRADIRAVIAAHETLWRERRNFLVAVRDYNNDIAEYAMTVAEIGASETVLVGMLIKPSSQPARKQAEPTVRTQPTPATRPEPTEPPLESEPSRFPATTITPKATGPAPARARADPFSSDVDAGQSILRSPPANIGQ